VRPALIGVWFRDDLERIRSFVRVCTRITHTDPKVEFGALAGRLESFGDLCPDLDFVEVVKRLEFDPGDGVSGYIHGTVPAAIALAVRHAGDYRSAVVVVGAVTDTVAEITGTIVGAD
jgi:ADP-ribosyl-[dinitrogen reductase] hydrolase